MANEQDKLFSSVDALLDHVADQDALPDPAERRRLREAGGLSQDQVARALSVRRETVTSWEVGRTEPRPPKRAAYARLLEGLAARYPVEPSTADLPAPTVPYASAPTTPQTAIPEPTGFPAPAQVPAPASPAAPAQTPSPAAAGTAPRPADPTVPPPTSQHPPAKNAQPKNSPSKNFPSKNFPSKNFPSNMHRKMTKLAASGLFPVAVLSDCAVYLSRGPSPLDFLPYTPEGKPVPGGFRLGVSPGMVKHEGTQDFLWLASMIEDEQLNPARHIKGTDAAADGE